MIESGEVMARQPALANLVYDYIRDMIEISYFKPGERLTEEMIIKKIHFNVSRSPVRSAFDMLVQDGYLVYRENKGVIVEDLKVYGLDSLDVKSVFLALFKGFIKDTYSNLYHDEFEGFLNDFVQCDRWSLIEWRNVLLADVNHYRSRVMLDILSDMEDRSILLPDVLDVISYEL